jgi:hypothetical protein
LERKGSDFTGSSPQSAPHKEKETDHQKGEKSVSSAQSKIFVPKDIFIWMLALEPLAGIGPKIKIQINKCNGGSDSSGRDPQSAPCI